MDEMVDIFKALGDKNRLSILDMLSCGEMCACDIIEGLGLSQSTISHHMKVLQDVKLVEGRKEGRWVHYSINNERVEEIREYLHYITNWKADCICNQVKKKVAFVCVHNSCRSQMAEGWLRHLGSDIFQVYSAGTEGYPEVKPLAIEVMEEVGVDMSPNHPKLLMDIPEKVDYLITMGCNVVCPVIPNAVMENWGIEDPSGGPIEGFRVTRDIIKAKVIDLIKREGGKIDESLI